MADMLIGHFMDQTAHAAWMKHAKVMYKLPDDPSVFGGAEKLPPPLFEGNFGQYTTQCILEKQLPQFVGSKEVSPGVEGSSLHSQGLSSTRSNQRICLS